MIVKNINFQSQNRCFKKLQIFGENSSHRASVCLKGVGGLKSYFFFGCGFPGWTEELIWVADTGQVDKDSYKKFLSLPYQLLPHNPPWVPSVLLQCLSIHVANSEYVGVRYHHLIIRHGTDDFEDHCHRSRTELAQIVFLLGVRVEVCVTKHLRYDDRQNDQGHRWSWLLWGWRWLGVSQAP